MTNKLLHLPGIELTTSSTQAVSGPNLAQSSGHPPLHQEIFVISRIFRNYIAFKLWQCCAHLILYPSYPYRSPSTTLLLSCHSRFWVHSPWLSSRKLLLLRKRKVRCMISPAYCHWLTNSTYRFSAPTWDFGSADRPCCWRSTACRYLLCFGAGQCTCWHSWSWCERYISAALFG